MAKTRADTFPIGSNLCAHEKDAKHAAMLQVKENKQAGVAIVEWICKKYDEMDREYSSISKHPLFQTENRGRTALHLAVRFGTLDLAEAIMKQAHQIGAADRLLKHTRSLGRAGMTPSQDAMSVFGGWVEQCAQAPRCACLVHGRSLAVEEFVGRYPRVAFFFVLPPAE